MSAPQLRVLEGYKDIVGYLADSGISYSSRTLRRLATREDDPLPLRQVRRGRVPLPGQRGRVYIVVDELNDWIERNLLGPLD